MANCCITFLFYSYAAASIIYLIIGAFAASGNAAVLTEHYKKNDNNTVDEDEIKAVKSRTLAQYFLASGMTVIISVILYIFFIIRGEKGYSSINQIQNIDNDLHKGNVIQIEEEEDDDNSNNKGNMPIEMAIGNNMNKSESYSVENEGMKETIN